jgi:hypothetical protein
MTKPSGEGALRQAETSRTASPGLSQLASWRRGGGALGERPDPQADDLEPELVDVHPAERLGEGLRDGRRGCRAGRARRPSSGTPAS